MQMAGVAAMGFIGGRLYGNYSFLYTLLRKFGKSDEEVRDFMEVRLGPLPEGIDIPTIPISTIGLLGDWIPLAVEMLPQQMKLKRQHQSIVASASERCRELRQRIRETNEKAGLIPLWHEEVWPLFWDLLQLLDGTNDDYFNPYVALKSELAKLLGKEDADTLLSALGGGGSGKLISVGPLVDMAKVARGEMTREAYIEQHGHREANENELAVPRPQEDPRWLDMQLAEFEQSPVDVQKLLEKSAAEFDAVWKKFEASHPKKTKKLRKKIDQFTEALHKREEVRSELTRSVGVMRHWFLRAGSLTGLGDDVFFLTYQEVLDILSGDDSATAYITIRRETYEEYSALPPYPMVIRGRFDPIQWASDPNRRTDYFDSLSPTSEAISTLRQAQDTASNTIRGVAGSAGRVEGVVRLLNSPSEGDQLRKGEILLATTTNIGWTPLFTRAAAVITDIGAPLSHAAIVARELGIPAVVGCGNATMRLRTGDRVLVDGGRGIIEILKAA
jgi:pyruvate,water dikinase